MTRDKAKKFLIDISYSLGNISIEYLSEKDGEKMREAIQVLEQEPKYCDRNICLRNEYNGIGCDECEVTKSKEPCDDAIIRILKRMWNCRGKHTTSIDKVKMEQILRDELPSVKPQEPCEDAISRQAVMDCFKKWQPYMATRLHEFEKELSELPTVAIPPDHDGCKDCKYVNRSTTEEPCVVCKQNYMDKWESRPHWIHRNDDSNDWLECPTCGYGSEGEVKYGEGTPFCPHCGERLEEK